MEFQWKKARGVLPLIFLCLLIFGCASYQVSAESRAKTDDPGSAIGGCGKGQTKGL